MGELRRLGEAYISLIYGRKSATAICRLPGIARHPFVGLLGF